MATVFGPEGPFGRLYADFSVQLPGPESSIACPFCGCALEVHWVVWDRKNTRGPRGGQLKHPEQLPFIVEPRVQIHECSEVAVDPQLPLRQEIAALRMVLHPFGWAPPSPEEKQRVEDLIDEKLAQLQEADHVAATP